MNLSSSLTSLLKYSNAKVFLIDGLSTDDKYLSTIGSRLFNLLQQRRLYKVHED